MILLDTHAWMWWVGLPERLSAPARRAIEEAEAIGVSPLSCYEVALLANRGRVQLDPDAGTWLRRALAAEGTFVADLHPAATVRAATLGPEFPGDPIDRMLYATAVELGARFVTRDERLRAADPVRTLW